MSRILAVIPARMASSRFPGKPLALLHGRPMLQHVFERTAACAELSEVVIATCDHDIAAAARSFGARPVMTSPSHPGAADRTAEVSAFDPAEIVVMIQGDEPMVQPEMITAAIAPLRADRQVMCANLGGRIRTEEELFDPNTIKVVTGATGDALYFSRSPIPHLGRRPFDDRFWTKQVCIIAFRREALQQFAQLLPGAVEQAESIDMLRFLENGIPVRIVPTEVTTHAVDTPDDLRYVSELMAS
jgi:3-deoxy-manno-octulosonate cytidylyltransferase (CMP-KDO synthetase)